MTKSVKITFICVFSLIIPFLCTLVTINIFNFKLNVVNITAFPLIIGLGIDYIIHIYYRIVKEKYHNIIESISSSGKAILFTYLTTLAAFISISFSAYPGLAQFGQIVCIGLTFSFLSSIFIVPNILKKYLFRLGG